MLCTPRVARPPWLGGHDSLGMPCIPIGGMFASERQPFERLGALNPCSGTATSVRWSCECIRMLCIHRARPLLLGGRGCSCTMCWCLAPLWCLTPFTGIPLGGILCSGLGLVCLLRSVISGSACVRLFVRSVTVRGVTKYTSETLTPHLRARFLVKTW